jgi:hypothetical protein
MKVRVYCTSATAAGAEADMKREAKPVWFSSLNTGVLLELFSPKFVGGLGGSLPPLDPPLAPPLTPWSYTFDSHNNHTPKSEWTQFDHWIQ